MSKYGAKPIVIDGIRFASQKEGRRYRELCLLEKAGAINSLITQPCYVLAAPKEWNIADGTFGGWTQIGVYRPDFEYFDLRTQQIVTEDVKGFKTPMYRWKKRHVEAQYGMQIVEI